LRSALLKIGSSSVRMISAWWGNTFSIRTRWTSGVRVGRGVGEYIQPVISVGGVAKRGEHDAARGDSGDDQGPVRRKRRGKPSRS
jgi:hypothetical protein